MIHTFGFEIKQVSDEGTFTGLASTYDNIDLVGDIVERGAFDRTLQGGGELPLLWQHRDPVGLVKLRDSQAGLIAEGRLSLGIQQGKDALVLLRDRVVRGLSIGFSVVKEKSDGAVRRLQELKLWEVSLTPIPANQAAQVTQVKQLLQQAKEEDDLKRALDFFRSDISRALKGR